MAEEINEFLKKHGYTKVELIQAGYEELLVRHNTAFAKLKDSYDDFFEFELKKFNEEKNKKISARNRASRITKGYRQATFQLRENLKWGFCGSLMTAETGTSHTGKLLHYYKCFGRKRKKHSYKKANYRQQDLEDLVFDTIVKYVLQPDVIQTVAE